MAMTTRPASSEYLAAKLFRGLADPTRLRILLTLAQGERRVADLVAQHGTVQSNISAHVACLRDCGLIDGRTEGRQTFYWLARSELFELLHAAEQLLAADGEAVRLCPNYETSGERS